MTKQVYKYQLTHNVTKINMPATGTVLTVQLQGETVVVWVLVDPKEATKERHFEVVGTGQTFNFDDRFPPAYLGTVQFGDLVWHCFEVF